MPVLLCRLEVIEQFCRQYVTHEESRPVYRLERDSCQCCRGDIPSSPLFQERRQEQTWHLERHIGCDVIVCCTAARGVAHREVCIGIYIEAEELSTPERITLGEAHTDAGASSPRCLMRVVCHHREVIWFVENTVNEHIERVTALGHVNVHGREYPLCCQPRQRLPQLSL